MDDTNSIEIAAGSVAGRVHRKLGRPNQDAVASVRTGGAVVLVVCDGCGGAARSEVGAALGARLLARALAARVTAGAAVDVALFTAATDEVVAQLAVLASAMASRDDRTATIVDHFMFTVLAAVITVDTVAIHAIGDGVIALGRAVEVLGPFADNAPPYLGQALLDRPVTGRTWVVPTARIDRVVLATDGADALLGGPPRAAAATADRRPVPTLDELADSDLVYRNPHALTRALSLHAEDAVEIDWDARRVVRHPAALDDDTTIALARWSPR